MRDREQWNNQFEPKPITATQSQKLAHVQNAFKELVKDVYDNVPDSDHKTSVLRKLLEAKQMCVHAIAHEG